MIRLGCAWYPEHWPTERWSTDLQLMRDAGMNVVRLAEFAWSRMESSEGHFTFDWLQQAVELATQYGMQVVLGTPTAAPPAWLTQKYPETLAIHQDGRQFTHGIRCHYNPASVTYRSFSSRIAEEMAKCFGQNPDVIGWQIDNEYHTVSYDAETLRQFQEWLRDRFGTLESLAEHWSTAYWSEDYSDWSQIPFPIGNHNPGLLLAFKEFVTQVYVDFQWLQIEAIRAHSLPEQWITHNFMKWFDGFDHYALSEDLDIASWDNYIPTGHLDYLENGAYHDLIRGLKRKNFWLMETQPGQVNWGSINTVLDRGEVRAMAWHAIGHGADAILYWQWRSALGGQEQMHGSLLAPDGKPRPVYGEVAQLGQELARLNSALEDTTVSAQVALLYSYEDQWAINFQRHHHEFDPVKHMLNYYGPLRLQGHTVDVVQPSAPLSAYKLVIAPNLNIIDQATAEHLLEYVWSGGHLVLGPRSGFKDAYNALLPSRQPGPLAAALGAQVEEYFALDHAIPVSGELGSGSASIWAEQLMADTPDAKILLTYGPSNGWLDNQPAAITRQVEAGRITYIGAWLDADLMRKVIAWLVEVSNVTSGQAAPPQGVELCVRVHGDKRVLIVINHTAQPQVYAASKPIDLPPHGVVVLQEGV